MRRLAMTKEEMYAYIDEHGTSPTLTEMHKAPIGWFPTHAGNPSKLIAHKFVNGKWVQLTYQKFVAWPDAFPAT